MPAPPHVGFPTRRHGIEIHEEWWCPAMLRRGVVDILRCGWTLPFAVLPTFLVTRLAPVHTLAAVMDELVLECQQRQRKPKPASRDAGDAPTTLIYDLASGMGGPMIELGRLRPQLQIRLSDLHPHVREWSRLVKSVPNVYFVNHSVSAYAVGKELQGMRTVMAAFHHFAPNDAVKVLRSAAEDGQPFLAVELTDRSIPTVCVIVVLTVLLSLLRGVQALFRGQIVDAFFTFVVPALPFIVAVDGVTSCWRTYTPSEFLALAAVADPDQRMEWRVTERPVVPFVPFFRMRCFIGIPR